MTQPDIIQTILKDSNYHLDLFTNTEVQALRAEIIIQTVSGKEIPFIRCPIRKKEIQLKPEELIRQLYAARLLKRYRYPRERVRFEHLVNFGRERKRADIRHYIGLIVCLCSSIFRYLIGTFLLKMRKNKDKLANYNR